MRTNNKKMMEIKSNSCDHVFLI